MLLGTKKDRKYMNTHQKLNITCNNKKQELTCKTC